LHKLIFFTFYVKKFEKHVKEVQMHSNELLTLFYKSNEYPEFDDPSKFWNGMQGLNDHFGNALYAVRKMEDEAMWRKGFYEGEAKGRKEGRELIFKVIQRRIDSFKDDVEGGRR